MAKRFSDSEKWRDPWFGMLPVELKFLWIYILDNCDHSGLWKLNKRLAEFEMGIIPPWGEGLGSVPNPFKDRVDANEHYWFIPKFLKWQYGENLNKGDAIISALEIIESKGFSESLKRVYGESIHSLGRVKAKAKAKAKASLSLELGEKIKEEGEEIKQQLVPIANNLQAKFLEKFKIAYEAMTGQPIKIDKKHFVIASKLIKDHGIEALEQKMNILGFMCRDKTAWFTKDGWSDFTIEKLSSQWNSILPQNTISEEDKSKQRMAELLRKENEKNERINKIVGR